jgi:hypothetical protein
VNIATIGPSHTNEKTIINNQLLMTNNQLIIALMGACPISHTLSIRVSFFKLDYHKPASLTFNEQLNHFPFFHFSNFPVVLFDAVY